MSRGRAIAGAAILGAAAAAFGISALWRAGAALSGIRDQVAREANLDVAVRPWVASVPPGLEPIGAPAVYSDAQAFQGGLFIGGPGGLTRYDSSGAVTARYRPGIELPPAPVTALAVGLAGDSPSPELWIATAGEGLVAFDGRGFRHIRPRQPAHAKITSLLAASTGRLLLGTEKAGVLVWDGSRLSEFHSSLAGVYVTALAGDDAGLWVGTLDRGLLHWRGGALHTIPGVDPRILSLAISGETVYAGTATGVAEVRADGVSRLLAPGYFAQTLFADRDKLWVGTLEEGMFEAPLSARPGRGALFGGPNVCPDCSIRRIFRLGEDLYTLAENSLWRGGEAVLRPDAAPLKDRNIAALASDSAGRLWIGYFDRGVQVLGPGGDRGLEFEDDILFCINRIVHDAGRGVAAVATANGLVLMDAAASRRRVIGQAEGLIANQVTDVALRPDGSIVAATPAGVSFIDASGISSIYAFQGLVNNHVYALAVDGARTLAGTLGGLSILDGGFVKASYTTANSALQHNWITAIVPVGGEYFVGTYGAGVVKLDALGHWETFDDLRGALEINPNAMAVSNLAVYAGTLDRGLAVYTRASGRWNFFTSGLPSRNVTAVEARGGILHIGTDNGVVKVPESSVVTP
jgi:hypothetical protein